MSNRSVDCEDFFNSKNVYQVPMRDALNELPDDVFSEKFDELVQWLEKRTEDKFMIMITNVWFVNERDAIIFRLGWKDAA